jgi:GTP-binding protein
VIFDWEPTLLAGAVAPAAPRGSDLRLEEPARLTRGARREQYETMRVARREARAELAGEREAGHWTDPTQGDGFAELPADDDVDQPALTGELTDERADELTEEPAEHDEHAVDHR